MAELSGQSAHRSLDKLRSGRVHRADRMLANGRLVEPIAGRRVRQDFLATSQGKQARRQTGPAAERSGNCLVKLAIRDEQPAFGGRVVVTLAKRDQTQKLPWNRLSVGTPVLLTEENTAGQGGWRGIVCRRDTSS